MSKFLYDRDQRGCPLEQLIANDLHSRGIPFGFNPYSGTDDLRRQDYDLYVGSPDFGDVIFTDQKMDWGSGITGNIFVEEKSLYGTKASHFIYGRLQLDTFSVAQLRAMFESGQFKKVIGGDQAGNRGMLLGWADIRANSVPYWKFRMDVIRQLQLTNAA